jgi:ferritin-like metal-binding protein YciE
MNNKQIAELVLQSLEHEVGGVKVYETAIKCARNPDLRREWKEYLEQTRTHVAALEAVCAALGLDPKRETNGRKIVETLRLLKSSPVNAWSSPKRRTTWIGR